MRAPQLLHALVWLLLLARTSPAPEPLPNATAAEPQVGFEQWQELPLSLKEQLATDCVDGQAQALLRPPPEPVNLLEVRERLRGRGVPIHLVCPFTRASTGRIAARYWVRNLQSRGGVVETVKLFVHPSDREATGLARELSRLNPGEIRMFRPPLSTVKQERPDPGSVSRLHWSWAMLNASQVLYIRVEDDVVFIEDGAIEMLAAAALLTPHEPPWLMLTANLVNTYTSPFLHSRLGAFQAAEPMQFVGDHYLQQAVLEAQHEQFLNRSLGGQPLTPYRFPGLWDLTACRLPHPPHGFRPGEVFQGHPRWGLHFCAMLGHDLPAERVRGGPGDVLLEMFDEEQFLTSYRPSTTQRPQAMVGMALAVHLEYRAQRGGASPSELTGALLQLYQQLAKEYCAEPLRTELR
eukprot:EG_transcript_10664